MQKINYIYGINGENKPVILGFEVTRIQNGKNIRQGFYYGLTFSIEDAIANKDNLKIADITKFQEEAIKKQSIGIIYFPSVDNYGFLEESDTVLNSYEELQALAESFENLKPHTSINDEDLEPDNSLAELRNIPNTLTRKSDR